MLPARAEAPTSVLDIALDRIDELYLDRATLDPVLMFTQAGQQLEREIDWLIADVEGPAVTLRYGNTRTLGTVEVSGWEDLSVGLKELVRLVRSAPEALDPEVNLELLLLKGATNALDRHSRVLDGERLEDFDKRLKGTFSGIGARIVIAPEGGLVVEEVFEGNPAAIAGLRVGDRLVRIDDEPTSGMRVDDATDRITGPLGSTVELTVLRKVGSGASARDMELLLVIERDEIRIPNLTWKVLEGGFGYIRIDHFSDQTELFLEQALTRLDEQAALDRGLVIDVRDNTGGSMIQSARAVDAFVTSGDLVRTVGPEGGKVKGLAEHIWADDDQTEPEVPILVLQNRRTASGAEILSGALRELERAVVIGNRSYGKGTVQKVYVLDADTRLKLTVARYLLAGDLSIADVGISPDLSVGTARFDADGVRLLNPVEEPKGPEPLLFVEADESWADQTSPDRGDLLLTLAMRILARSEGASRYELLQAAGELRELVSAEEEQRLVSTFAQRGIDWSTAPKGGSAPLVKVQLQAADGAPGQPLTVTATVTNSGTVALHRVAVRLSCADYTWDDLVLPVGLVPPGQSRSGQVVVRVPPVTAPRESVVGMRVEADRRPSADAGHALLRYSGAELPSLRVSSRLRVVGTEQRAEIVLRNTSDRPLAGLHVYLSSPAASGVMLGEHEALLPSLAAGQVGTVQLKLDLSRLTTGPVPLEITVEEERLGGLLRWSAELPRDGLAVDLEAPRVTVDPAPYSMAPGPTTLNIKVSDDRNITRVIAWEDNEKVGVYAGGAKKAQVAVPVVIMPGLNSFYFEAVDDQGLRRGRWVYVRGLEDGDLSSDAGG